MSEHFDSDHLIIGCAFSKDAIDMSRNSCYTDGDFSPNRHRPLVGQRNERLRDSLVGVPARTFRQAWDGSSAVLCINFVSDGLRDSGAQRPVANKA